MLSGDHYYRHHTELGSRGTVDKNIFKQLTKQRKPIPGKEDDRGATIKCYVNPRGQRNIGPQTNFLSGKELKSGTSKKTERQIEVSRRMPITAMKEASKNVAQLYPVTGVNTEACADVKQSSLLKAGHIGISPWTVHGNYIEPRQIRFYRSTKFPSIPSGNGRQNEQTSQRKRHVSLQYVPRTYKLKRQTPNNYPAQTNTTAYKETYSYLSFPYPYQDIHNSDSVSNQHRSNYNPHSQLNPSTYNHQEEYHSQPTYYSSIPSKDPLRYQRLPVTYPQNIPSYQNTFQHYTLPQTLPYINPSETRAGNKDTQQKKTGYWSKDQSIDPEDKYVATSKTFQNSVNQHPTGELPKANHPTNENYRYQDSDISLGTTTMNIKDIGSPYAEFEDEKVLSSHAPPRKTILSSETKVQSLNNKPNGFHYNPVQENKRLMSMDDHGNMPKTVLHSKTSNLQEKRIHPPQVESAFTRREEDSDQQPLTEYYTDQKKRESNVNSYYKPPSSDATSSDYLDIHRDNNELNNPELRKLSLLTFTTISPEQTDSDLTHPPPLDMQTSYPDGYLVNENASIQKHEESLSRETNESPPQYNYETSYLNYQTRDTSGETTEISLPLPLIGNESDPSSTEILNTCSPGPTNTCKPSDTFETLQTSSSPTETEQEESGLTATKSEPIISNYQKNLIPPKQKSTTRMSRKSAIEQDDIMPSSTSTTEPELLNYTHSVVTNVDYDKDPKSIHISSEYTEEIREITTVAKTYEPPQLASSDKSQRLSLPVGAKNIVITLSNGEDIVIDNASSAESSTPSMKVSSDTSTQDPFSVIDIRGLLSVSATGTQTDSESYKHPILSVEPHIYSEIEAIPNPAIISENHVIDDDKILSETTLSEWHNLIQNSPFQLTTKIPSLYADLQLVSTTSEVFSVTTPTIHPVTLPISSYEDSIATTTATKTFRAQQLEDNEKMENIKTVPSLPGSNYRQNAIAKGRALLYDSDKNVLKTSLYKDRQESEDVLKVTEGEADISHNKRIMYTYENDDELEEEKTPFSTVTEVLPSRTSDTIDWNSHIINRSNQIESPIMAQYVPPYLTEHSSGKALHALNTDIGTSALTDSDAEYDERRKTEDKKVRVFRFRGNCKCKCI
jgi:hypothetical protein